MKTVRFVRVFTVVVAISATIIGCDSENPISTTASGPTPSSQVTPVVTLPEIARSDGGNTYVRADGWPIPSFDEAKREEFETSITSGDGRSVKVRRTVIRTDPLSLYIDNPLHLIGIGYKQIRINTVMGYRTSAGIFCYKFLVNDAEVDESTNRFRSARRVLYPYSYYDENGDGVFESLVLNEMDRNGRKGFASEPHVPGWAIAKDQ